LQQNPKNGNEILSQHSNHLRNNCSEGTRYPTPTTSTKNSPPALPAQETTKKKNPEKQNTKLKKKKKKIL
jgi:hypothetical protein